METETKVLVVEDEYNREKSLKQIIQQNPELIILDSGQLLAAMRNNGPRKLAIHSQNETEYIDINTIVRLEADGCYTHVYLESGRKITVSKALREYEGLLLNADFTRVHNSHVINMHHVRKFVKKDGLMVKMTGDCCVPIAIRRRDIFEEKLKSVAI